MEQIKSFSDMVLWADQLAKINWPKNGVIHISDDELLLELQDKIYPSMQGGTLTSCNIKLSGYDFVVKKQWKYEPEKEEANRL